MTTLHNLRRWVSGLLLGAAAIATAAPALAADTHLVFVSNERSNEVVVIDPAKDFTIVKRIATSRRPRDMAFNQAHTILYVACGDDDVIDVIDVASMEVVDNIPTGRSPEMFRLSLDDKLMYVSNEEASTVEVIDIEQKVVVGDIATGAEPEGIQLSPDGKVVYATSEVADMVHFIDPVENVVTENVIVGTRPRRFILPNANELWVTDELSGTVTVIDTQTATVTNTIEFLPPGFRQVDVTPVGITMTHDGKVAIVTLGRANHVAFVNIATKEIETYVLVGSRAWGVEIDKADKNVYVANGLSDDLSIIDYATRQNIKTFPVGRIPHSVVIDD